MARTIHVHADEVSTAPDAVSGYARGIVIALAVAAILLSAWIAMNPAETSVLEQVAPNVQATPPEPLLPAQPEWLTGGVRDATTPQSPVFVPAPAQTPAPPVEIG
ncbi:MAG: hypothetical protein JWM90_2712 [Thermoleophilia bacterium]|nr:hypothetical protein [Thermoleophilia bacterium]